MSSLGDVPIPGEPGESSSLHARDDRPPPAFRGRTAGRRRTDSEIARDSENQVPCTGGRSYPRRCAKQSLQKTGRSPRGLKGTWAGLPHSEQTTENISLRPPP